MAGSKRKKSSSAASSPTTTTAAAGIATAATKRPRKKATSSKKDSSKTAAGADSTSVDADQVMSSDTPKMEQVQVPTCMPIVVLDSGGWTVKHGTVLPSNHPSRTAPDGDNDNDNVNVDVDVNNSGNDTSNNNRFKPPESICSYTETPNCTGKLRHQIAVLVGDEIHTVKNKTQLELSHPLERGYCTNFACQLDVWKRVMQREYELKFNFPPSDNLHLNLKTQQSRRRIKPAAARNRNFEVSLSFPQCAFLLTQPFTPTTLSDRIDEMLFLDLGFHRVSKRLIQCMSAFHYLETSSNTTATTTTTCCLVVDSGFSLTHIVPTVNARAVENGIRRINIGGKLLTNLYKETVSYRQWNMMDEFFIMNEVKEQTSFISDNFHHDLGRHARENRVGFRWYDREFVLPNFVDTFVGSVRLPAPLQRQKDQKQEEELLLKQSQIEEEKNKCRKEKEENMEDDTSASLDTNDINISKEKEEESNDHVDTATANDNDNDNGNDDDDNDDDNDDDSDTEEQRMKEIQQLKLQEKRRRELEQQEQQVLSVSVERFTVPEVLFHPQDIGLDQLGIVDAIVQSIEACDATLRAAMYQNILLTGGNVKMPGFKERLERELRACAPGQYKVSITLPEDPVGYPWLGASSFAQQKGFLENYSLDKFTWEELNKKKKGMDDSYLWTKLDKKDTEKNDSYIVV